MKFLKTTLTTLTIVGVIATIGLQAEPFGKGGEFMEDRMEMRKHFKSKHQNMKKIFKQLNLSDEQKTSLKANRDEMRNTMKDKRKEFKNSRSISKFISVDGVDREGLIEQATQHATLRAGNRADMMEKTLKILTAEQKIKFVELLKAQK